jgi:ligand-binding sensor domain-containing protein/two-component sensor histidine kinase
MLVILSKYYVQKLRAYCYLVLVILLLSNTCPAQQFEQITAKNGLPDNIIAAMVQDQTGYLWLGTSAGLYQYDGYNFYLAGNSTGVRSLAYSQQASLWGDDDHGFFRINTQSKQKIYYIKHQYSDANPNNDQYNNLFVDSRQRIWMCDFQHVKYFDTKSKVLKTFLISTKKQSANFAHFAQDSSGNIWIATELGLWQFNNSSQKLQLKIPKVNFSAILVQNMQLTLATQYGQILSYTIGNEILTAKNSYKIGNPVRLIRASTEQQLWLATSGMLYQYNSSKNTATEVQSLSSEGYIFNEILEDKANNITWIATTAGLLKNNRLATKIETIALPQGLVQLPVTVNSIAEGSGGQLWLGLSHTGVLAYQPATGGFQLYKMPGNNNIKKLQMLAGNQLLCIADRAVYVLSQGRYKLLYQSPHDIKTGFADSQKRLWLLCPEQAIKVLQLPSLQAITPWSALPYPEFFSQNLFNDLTETPGKIWLAAWFPKGFGICYLDEASRKFVQISESNNPKHFMGDYFLSVSKTADKQLIFSGYGGLNIVNEQGKITKGIFSDNPMYGFRSSNFKSTIADSKGAIWLSTTNGLYQIHNSKALRYSELDGLSTNFLQNAFILSQRQVLYMGQKNKINALKINNLGQTSSPKRLKISNINILGSNKKVQPNRSFARTENNLSFQFSNLNFAPLHQNFFQYRLQPNTSWISNGNQNTLSFSNLSPGSYLLQVRVGNHLGRWSAAELLAFDIEPYFYETLWFKILALSLLALFFYGLYRFRLAQILQTQAVRSRISRDLHDEVGATMSGIAIIGSMFKQKLAHDPKSLSLAQRLVEDATSVSATLDDIIWSIRPQNDQLLNLSARMKRYAAELFEAKNIDYQIDMPPASFKYSLNMALRHDLYLIFKEAVNNLVKYAQCSHATIKLSINKKQLEISIADNGVGFDPKSSSHGNGLRNMQERCLNLGGSIHINSNLGLGTSIVIILPI